MLFHGRGVLTKARGNQKDLRGPGLSNKIVGCPFCASVAVSSGCDVGRGDPCMATSHTASCDPHTTAHAASGQQVQCYKDCPDITY